MNSAVVSGPCSRTTWAHGPKKQVTAAAITAGSSAAYVDYRTDYDSVSYELVTHLSRSPPGYGG
ncbi:MAG: hypothetical protein M3Y48_05655 [Actinomycetota bacterium]|nr:hypothetical protein [Actinomycetota bacterium]